MTQTALFVFSEQKIEQFNIPATTGYLYPRATRTQCAQMFTRFYKNYFLMLIAAVYAAITPADVPP